MNNYNKCIKCFNLNCHINPKNSNKPRCGSKICWDLWEKYKKDNKNEE